jgi:hypothetical protein
LTVFYFKNKKKYGVRRFVHFAVLCNEKYWYSENSAANPNFKKSPDIGLKIPRAFFKKNP